MTDSIVDLGAAGEYISEKFEDVVDYFTGAPKARAGSRGFFKDLGPGVRQYYLGPGEKEGESFFEYLGFEDGGVALPQEDMDEFVDFIRRNRSSIKEGQGEAKRGPLAPGGVKEYRYFGDYLGMEEYNPNARIVVDGQVVQEPPVPPSFAGKADPLGIGGFFGDMTDEGFKPVKPQEEGGFADPQYPRRRIEDQDFSGIRGFQMGTKIKLNERDDAVGTKLMRQAGLQASANQVMDNLDPKVLAQMSRILGRNIG